MKNNSRIPEILKKYRNDLGYTLEEVVSKLKDRGIDLSIKTLCGYENAVSFPNVNTFVCLCDIYGITNIMGEFGYHVPIASGKSEWSPDLYNDFFNASLLECVYILLKHGVPSFEGYFDQLSNKFPANSDNANYNRLWSLFSSLDESMQSQVFFYLDEIKKSHVPYITQDDLNLLSCYHLLNSKGQSELKFQLQHILESDEYKKSADPGSLPAAQ